MEGEKQLTETLEAVRAAYVDESGAADFAGMLASREHGRLAATLAGLADFDPRRLRIPAQTAFWINLHNACILRDALELEVEGFDRRPRVRVAGHSFSLYDIEHGLLRGDMKKADPRLALTPPTYDERTHFGIYNARRSSPPLRVFRGETLESQLEQATESYLRATVRMKDEEYRVKLRLPMLFKRYGDDFGDERGVLEFVLARLDEEIAQLVDRREGRVKFMYLDYDSALNRKVI
jgi:hypothetical protein